jgi:hypothetical protein
MSNDNDEAETRAHQAPHATTALALMVQDWGTISLGTDPDVKASSDVEVCIDRITALLTVRLAAIAAPLGTYPDLSIQNICRNVLLKNRDWPMELTDEVLGQLREFVAKMLKGYKQVPYHNFEHAYHVVLSACKLMDMFLATTKETLTKKSYGLRNDPILLMALAFSCLIHDVEHQGLPNRQLAAEKDRLAVLYNDQSIAENWSLYIAFSELLQDEFNALRSCMFPADGENTSEDVYQRFRKHVVNLVLCTDIASPERTQIGKSKWKEAFGDPFETVERKVRAEMRRASIGMAGKIIGGPPVLRGSQKSRRGSEFSEISSGQAAPTTSAPPRPGPALSDDDSLSGTPENSQHGGVDEFGGESGAISPVLMTGVSDHGYYNNKKSPATSQDDSGTMLQHLQSKNAGNANTIDYGYGSSHQPIDRDRQARFTRRLSTGSTATTATTRYRQRLGILRTVDLSGETFETYNRQGSMANGTVVSEDKAYMIELNDDDPDELKASVVMETIMTAADVAHNLQSFEQMQKWANRLYLELRKAYVENRGIDASPKWFENQIGFLECYLLPLARKLEDTGVFADSDAQFARHVENNRDRWLTDGYEASVKSVKEGAEKFLMPE